MLVITTKRGASHDFLGAAKLQSAPGPITNATPLLLIILGPGTDPMSLYILLLLLGRCCSKTTYDSVVSVRIRLNLGQTVFEVMAATLKVVHTNY